MSVLRRQNLTSPVPGAYTDTEEGAARRRLPSIRQGDVRRNRASPGKGKQMAQFTNQAQLSYNNSTVSSNVVTGQLQEVLSATKTAVNVSYRVGDTVTYALNLINSGTTALTGLTVTDNLGAYSPETGTTYLPLSYVEDTARYFINGVPQQAPNVTAGDSLVISGITVPAGGNTTVLYDARVNGYADPTATGTLTNTATVAGGGISSLTATATIPANTAALLSITKSVSPVPVVENGLLTYTFRIENTGSTAVDAGGNITVTDTFLPILNGITVTLDGTALVAGTDYTYDETTGVFATVPGRITVPAATYTRGEDGIFVVAPGAATLVVSGTV